MPPALVIEEDAVQTNSPARKPHFLEQCVPKLTRSKGPDSGVFDQDSAKAPWSPELVLATIPDDRRPTSGTPSPVSFFHMLERLKTTKREGWRRFGINHGESISDHMYRMSIITMLAPPSLSAKINVPHCTKMALIHDMAELLVGDITPVDGVLKSEKSRREAESMDFLTKDLLGKVGGGLAGEDMRKIWQEYEDSETMESKFVHDVDKMELILQMVEYEKAHGGRIDLGEFTWVATRIVLPEVQSWCEQVLQERTAYWSKLGTRPAGSEMNEDREAQQEQYYGKVNGGDSEK